MIYASIDPNLKRGYGLVVNSDYSFLETMTYGNVTKHPEQHLVDRVARYWSNAKRSIHASLRAEVVGEITPRNIATLDGTTGYVVSISHDWWDDVVRIVTMEV